MNFASMSPARTSRSSSSSSLTLSPLPTDTSGYISLPLHPGNNNISDGPRNLALFSSCREDVTMYAAPPTTVPGMIQRIGRCKRSFTESRQRRKSKVGV